MNPEVNKSLLGGTLVNQFLGGAASRLAGGLNLLAAPDSDQPGEAIAAQNWRTDQAGMLRSRQGHTLVQALSGNVHTIFSVQGVAGLLRYYGADDKLYRAGVQIGSGFDTNPLGMVSFQDRLWVMNPNGQKKDDGTNYWAWTPAESGAAPTGVAGGAATGGLNGDYVYYASGVTDENEETNAAYGLYVTGLAANDSVTITRPAFADPQITHWNLYRTGGSFPLQPYRVNASPILLASTYQDKGQDLTGTGGDNQTDLGIASLGITRPTDHTPAPAAKGCAGPYFNRILAFNTAAHPNRLFWTPSNQPSYFPGANSDQDGNWVDVGEEGEPILAVAVFPRWVAILKSKSIHRLVGDPDNWNSDIERTNAEVGQMGTKAWAIAGSTVYLQAEEGIYAFNGDQAVKISQQLDPIFKGDGVATANAIPSVAINTAARNAACMAYRNGRLYYSYCDGSNTTPNLTLVNEGGRWVTDTRGWSALYYEGQGNAMLGAVGGSAYALGTTDTDNGAAIPLIYQSRFSDQGAPENRKRYSDVLIDHNTGGHTFSVWAYVDNGSANIFLGTITSTARTQTSFIIGDSEYLNLAFRIASTDAGSGHAEIYALAVHYITLERNARTYDSEKIALERLSLLNAIEMNLEILSGTVTYAFYAGSTALAQVATGVLSGSVQSFPIALAANTQGQWVRLILNGDNYRSFGARLQLQPLGPEGIPVAPRIQPLLAGGQAAEGTFLNQRTYDTGRVALDKVSSLNTLQVALEIFSGSVSYTLEAGLNQAADLPVVVSGTYSGSTQTFTTQLPSPLTEARWVRLILTGTNYKCHGAKIELQPIGEFLTGVGDKYTSGDLTLGSPRVKLLSQVRVDCDPDGTIPGAFYTDTPGGALISRQALSLTASAGRAWQRQNLPRDTRGRVLRIEFTAPYVCRIYAIQVRAKVLGEGSISWQWLDVPVDPTPAGYSWVPLPIQ